VKGGGEKKRTAACRLPNDTGEEIEKGRTGKGEKRG